MTQTGSIRNKPWMSLRSLVFFSSSHAVQLCRTFLWRLWFCVLVCVCECCVCVCVSVCACARVWVVCVCACVCGCVHISEEFKAGLSWTLFCSEMSSWPDHIQTESIINKPRTSLSSLVFFSSFTFSHFADAFIQSDLQLGNTWSDSSWLQNSGCVCTWMA